MAEQRIGGEAAQSRGRHGRLSGMQCIVQFRRRNVIRMAGLWLAVAWLLTEISGTILSIFGASDWVARTVVMVLAIGAAPAPLVLWVFELTPEGLKRDSSAPAADSIAAQIARRVDRMLPLMMALAPRRRRLPL